MAQLPMNRTRLNAAIANQQPSIIAASQANREAHIEAADTIDMLYNYTSGLVAGGPLQPYPHGVNRNAFINPGFSVNQRVKSGTVVLTAGQYGHDRWKAGAAGCTYTFATVNNVTTITITAGSLIQVIEGNNLYSGTYTLSWTGTAQARVEVSANYPSPVAVTVIGGVNLSIEFNVGTLSKVQFTAGDAALPFQPRSFAEELALCQRYYEKSYQLSVAPGSVSSPGSESFRVQATGTYVLAPTTRLKVQKRVLPTVTLYSSATGASGKWKVNSADVTASVYNAAESSFGSFISQLWTQNDTVDYQWTADAEL